MPRIIAGKNKSLPLKTPKHNYTRPTSDRSKAGLFSSVESILGRRGLNWQYISVLDLYAGSGQLALEALSRGALEACLVERRSDVIKIIKDNIEFCRQSDKAIIYHQDVFQALASLQKKQKKFNLFLLDPPYQDFAKILPDLLAQTSKIAKDEYSLLVIEGPDYDLSRLTKLELGQELTWHYLKRLNYASSYFYYFEIARLNKEECNI